MGSVMVGIGYGGIFTLAPTVVSVVWGVGGFGRNWGILTFSPGKNPDHPGCELLLCLCELLFRRLFDGWFFVSSAFFVG